MATYCIEQGAYYIQPELCLLLKDDGTVENLFKEEPIQ